MCIINPEERTKVNNHYLSFNFMVITFRMYDNNILVNNSIFIILKRKHIYVKHLFFPQAVLCLKIISKNTEVCVEITVSSLKK